MENTQPADQQTNNACANCGNPQVVEGYNTRLCHDCRQQFIKYPIPLWIKLFAGGIGLIVLFSLYTFPKDLSSGLHFERGKKAERAKNYYTAQTEFNKVIAKVPGDEEAMAHLALVSFYNMDYQTFMGTLKKMSGKNIDDEDYMAHMNNVLDKVDEYINTTAYDSLEKKYANEKDGVPDTATERYLKENPNDFTTMYSYAGHLYEMKSYNACDSLAKLILSIDKEYQPALLLQCAADRELGNWDSAISCCDRMLAINREASYAIAAKARVLLKQKKDKEALTEALESVEVNGTDPYSKATLALAYHFNNEPGKRDALVKQAFQSTDSSGIRDMQTVVDIINGKKNFR